MPQRRADAHLPKPRVPTRGWLIAAAGVLLLAIVGGVGLTHTIDRVNRDRMDVLVQGFEDGVADRMAGFRMVGLVLPVVLDLPAGGDTNDAATPLDGINELMGDTGVAAAFIGAFPLDGFGGLGFVAINDDGTLQATVFPNGQGVTAATMLEPPLPELIRNAYDSGDSTLSPPLERERGVIYVLAAPTDGNVVVVVLITIDDLLAGPTRRGGEQILEVVATDTGAGLVVGRTDDVPADADPYRTLEASLLGTPITYDVYPGVGANWQVAWIPGLTAGALIGAIAVLVYITGVVRRRRVVEQEERLRLAREINQDKDHFIAAVSHELRTPLTSVLGLAEELTTGINDFTADQVRELAAIMAQESNEVALLVEDLLIAARAEAGTAVVRPEIVDVDLQIARVCASLDPGAGVNVQRSGVSVWADPLRLRQILRNLITNAVRHGGPHVLVSAETNGRHTIIEVRDDGDGIQGEARTRMFEPYYRSAAVRGQAPSVGLGLTVSYQLARAMDGELSYDYTGGWGIFRLEFPAVMVGTPRVQRLADSVAD